MQYFMDNMGNEELGMKNAFNDAGKQLPCLQRCSFQVRYLSNLWMDAIFS